MISWFRKKEPAPLPFSTDIHCHIIPGVDDGSESVDKSVELLQHMQQWGITRIIPTPHHTEEYFENTAATIDPQRESLVAAAREAGITVGIMPASGEYRLDSYFVDLLGKGLVRPLAGSYLLIENNFSMEPYDIDSTLFDLSLKGYKPVMAHPERYTYYHRNPDRYRRLHKNGALFQCNLMSLGGYYGKEIRKTAEWMLENDLIDFLGTDLHGMRHVEFIERYMTTADFARISQALKGRLLNDTIIP